MNTTTCPVCDNGLLRPSSSVGNRDAARFSCPRCGEFVLSRTLEVSLPRTLQDDPDAFAKLSHALRRAQENNRVPEFMTTTVDEVLKRPLPRPKEQADLLIRWLATNLQGPGEQVRLAPSTHGGVVGARSDAGFALVVDHLFSTGMLIGNQLKTIDTQGEALATLSFQGWDYYEELAKGGAAYRKAFMAMKFGEQDLETMLTVAFKPAAKLAGFDLFKLDEVPRAGLIDDRLRVEIQASDFLVADLSHDNLGAYWEAGYAEGLGKPVIYSCERRKFELTKTHFDTNHHLTIVWDAESPEVAAAHLKATIRATLPHLAKQTDETT